MAYDKFAAVDSSSLLFPPSVRENLAGVSPNYIINGAFEINQRNFSSTTTSGYGFDRWIGEGTGGTVTYSSQAFTPGSAPVAGYEAKNFARIVTSGQSLSTHYAYLAQKIEDARTLANQTSTISFWAKATSGTPKIAVEIYQTFGTGGSPSSAVTVYAGQITLSTSWARYSVTVSVPSISGKTFGTNNDSVLGLNLFVSAGSNFNSRTGSLGIQSNTFDFWGVQVEAGAVATGFRRNANSIQGELAACQRYYVRFSNSLANNVRVGVGHQVSTTNASTNVYLSVPMRVMPSSLGYSNVGVSDNTSYDSLVTNLTFVFPQNLTSVIHLNATINSAGAQYRPVFLYLQNNGSYLEFNAEL